MSHKLFSAFLLFALALSLPCALRPQAVESARTSKLSLSAGGMGSIFQPAYAGNWPYNSAYPKAGSSDYPLIGIGAYVDIQFNKWIGIEAVGRWQRFNQYNNISQANYLIGPKVPITRIKNINFYGKALVGYSTMNFGAYDATGRFTTIAFGGGGEIKLSRHFIYRPADFEYQYWPTWGNSSLKPYGLSTGLAYRIF